VTALDETHEPDAQTWHESARGHPDFPIQNLPFGIFTPHGAGELPRGGVRVGDDILDLQRLSRSDLLTGKALTAAQAASGSTLNDLFALGAGPRKALRSRIHQLLRAGFTGETAVRSLLHREQDCTMALPATVGDYTDFYVGIHHAMAVGALFRPENPLLPNYKWIPIAYHGRSSTIRVSGEPFRRPNGQRKDSSATPTFGASRNLDFELEMGVWVGPGNGDGEPIHVDRAAAHVAGYCLLNDWSARDIQSWEYQPLGPFLAKNFATTVSAWVVTPEALAPYTSGMRRPSGDPDPLPYLTDGADQTSGGLDVELEALISTPRMRAESMAPQRLSISSSRHMYWTVAQMIAHHTSNGCVLRPGDLLGTGTLSGPDISEAGSMMELSHGGRQAIDLISGESRTYLCDGDEILLRARASRQGLAPIGFGDCRAVVLPAVEAGRR
jgi:fumarylacetoacetase